MKKFIIIFILMGSILVASNYKTNKLKTEFGLAAGMNIGYGLTFKHNIDENFALRVTGGYIKDNNQNFYNLGLELNYSIKKNNLMNFYLSIGALHTYEDTNDYYYDYNYNAYSNNRTSYNRDTRGVIGMGISSYIEDLISISIEAHEVFEYSFETNEKGYKFNIYPMVGITFGILF